MNTLATIFTGLALVAIVIGFIEGDYDAVLWISSAMVWSLLYISK